MSRGYTGEILPRDYGLMIRKHSEKLFVSPSKFAFALATVESPSDLERRIRDIARIRKESLRSVGGALRDAVKRKAPGLWLKENGIRGMGKYQRGFHALVRSKSDPKKEYSVSITHIDTVSHLGHCRPRCECDDGLYGSHKDVYLMCCHAATIAAALDIDRRSKKPVEENVSGLPPRERIGIPRIPFRYYAQNNPDGLCADSVMSTILFDILVGGLPQFKVNRKVLDTPHMFPEWVRHAICDEYDRAQFEVLREEEREGERSRLDSSVKALESRLEAVLAGQNFFPNRYVLDFKGTEHECVARRFRKKDSDVVYDIIVTKNFLPIVVRKILGIRPQNFLNGDDVRKDHPYTRVEEKPNIDDCTRKECKELVIIPSRHPDFSRLVSKELAQAYDATLGVERSQE